MSQRIQERFFLLLEKWFHESASFLKIMSYVSLKEEVDTIQIVNHIIKMNRVIWIPRCNGNQLEAVEVTSLEGLQPGRFGISEPGHDFSVLNEIQELDVIIVPGLGFDRFCNRLGRGKGYFDRFLSRLGNHPVTIGLAFDIQIIDYIPCTANSGNKPLPFSLPLI